MLVKLQGIDKIRLYVIFFMEILHQSCASSGA